MSNRDDARRALEAAQARLDALSRVPEDDDYPVGTILRWRKTGETTTRAAIKTHIGTGWGTTTTVWNVTGSREDLYQQWPYLVAAFLSAPLDFYEAATDWEDARETPPTPPLTVAHTPGTDPRWTITDETTGNRWALTTDRNQWVRVNPKDTP